MERAARKNFHVTLPGEMCRAIRSLCSLPAPGLNAGMLVRCLLEKCKTTGEALAALNRLPIASAQTLTIADVNGEIAVVECNPAKVVVIRPRAGESFVATANNFNSEVMAQYRNPGVDDWRSDELAVFLTIGYTRNQKRVSKS